jgi:anion-transporting  ArsA/GET3 family ATPase
MPLGPGKYDDLCTAAREAAKARGVLLIVIDGAHGSGFACQADLQTTATLPDLLEKVARDIRRAGIAG